MCGAPTNHHVLFGGIWPSWIDTRSGLSVLRLRIDAYYVLTVTYQFKSGLKTRTYAILNPIASDKSCSS